MMKLIILAGLILIVFFSSPKLVVRGNESINESEIACAIHASFDNCKE